MVCCIGSDSVNKGFTFSFHLFNVLQSSLFNFSYFCFVCLFFPTQIPQLLCLHLVQVCILLKLSKHCVSLLVLFLLFASSHFSHIFLLLLVFFPVLRCDKISFTSNIWQLSPSAAFVNHYFGNFSLPFMLPFMFLFMLGSFMSLKEWTFIWLLECGATLPLGNVAPFWGSPSEYIKFRFRNKALKKNVTLSDGWLYTCYAKNSFEHAILTVKVYFKGTVMKERNRASLLFLVY